jgi:hypothetical protein
MRLRRQVRRLIDEHDAIDLVLDLPQVSDCTINWLMRRIGSLE